MPRVAQRAEMLTKRRVEELEPEAKRYRVADLGQRGLKLVVEPSGRKFWTVKYVTSDGRESEKVLGEWPSVLPEAARTDAGTVRSRVKRQGVDPAEEARQTRREAEQTRKEAAEAREQTFQKLAEAYLSASARGFRAGKQRLPKAQSTIAKERQHLNKHVVPALGERPISQIKRKEIVALLENVAVQSGEDAANGCLEAIRRAFAYGRHKDLLENNPAVEISRYARPPRDVIASDAVLQSLWLTLEETKKPKVSKTPNANPNRPRTGGHGRKDCFPSATALQIALLTLQRRGEIVAIHKDHIDWGRRLWTIPSLNKKERRRGLVPLSPMAIKLLKEAFAHSKSEWAFAGRNPHQHIGAHSLTRFMARLREETGIQDITPHDLRRTGRTKLTSDEVGVDEMTAERVLNHVVGSRQQRAYDWQAYISQKRAALDAWEKELKRIVFGEARNANSIRKAQP